MPSDKHGPKMAARIAALEAENAKLKEALEASIAANELVLAQLRGGQDLTEAQVTKAMNAALAKARAALKHQESDKE